MNRPNFNLPNPKKIINLRFWQLNRPQFTKLKFPIKFRFSSDVLISKLEEFKKSIFYAPFLVLAFGLIASAVVLSVNSLLVPEVRVSYNTQNLEPATPALEQEEEFILNPAQTYPVAETSTSAEETNATLAPEKPQDLAPATQREEQKPVLELTAMEWPLDGQLGQGFGFAYSEIHEDYRLHPGVDIQAQQGSPVRAALAGEVKAVEALPQGGFQITLQHNADWQTVYRPVTTALTPGDRVEKGEVLGWLESGYPQEEGSSLHYELRRQGEPVDPVKYLSH